jgi:hypothetical protein
VFNKDKCLFGCTEMEFLGHQLTAYGISLLPCHAQAIASFLQPAFIKQLQAFSASSISTGVCHPPGAAPDVWCSVLQI